MSIDQRLFFPRVPVAIIALGDSGEALLLRAILESLGAAVTLHLPGTPGDFLTCLDRRGENATHLVISGHGDDNGFVFGDFGSEIDTSLLADGSMPPSNLVGQIHLAPDTIVVSTACYTGAAEFAEVFLKGGAAAYVAPSDAPDGSDAPLFLHMFFHAFLRRQVAPHDAMLAATELLPDNSWVCVTDAGCSHSSAS